MKPDHELLPVGVQARATRSDIGRTLRRAFALEIAALYSETMGSESATTIRAERAAELREFLRTIERPDRPLDGADGRTSLVAAGLIDSLAVLEIVAYLETRYGVDFAETGVDPEELSSIEGILDLIDRFAR
jgi:acyl carrier protein